MKNFFNELKYALLFMFLGGMLFLTISTTTVSAPVKTQIIENADPLYIQSYIEPMAKIGYKLQAAIPKYHISTSGDRHYQRGPATPKTLTLIFQK